MKDIIRVFKALSEPTRLRIFMLLAEQELCVCELTYILEMSQSRVSHQLRLLRDADLVEDVRDGRWIIYRVPEGVRSTFKPLIERFAGNATLPSRRLVQDLERLDICLRDDVRKRAGRAATA